MMKCCEQIKFALFVFRALLSQASNLFKKESPDQIHHGLISRERATRP